MKTPERFDRALKALVQAFFNDTLAKGRCKMCAVGNMCGGSDAWSDVFMTSNKQQRFYPENYTGLAKKVIDSTNYSWQELAAIEKAFELNTKIRSELYCEYSKQSIMEDQFKGLMAVVDVLCEIEGLESSEYKKAFEYSESFEPVNVLV